MKLLQNNKNTKKLAARYCVEKIRSLYKHFPVILNKTFVIRIVF